VEVQGAFRQLATKELELTIESISGADIMGALSERVLNTVTPGAVGVVVLFEQRITIFEFKKHELTEAIETFAPFMPIRDNRWRECFRQAFTDPLPPRHVATVLIRECAVENGVVFSNLEAN